jgi:hypothetical protein
MKRTKMIAKARKHSVKRGWAMHRELSQKFVEHREAMAEAMRPAAKFIWDSLIKGVEDQGGIFKMKYPGEPPTPERARMLQAIADEVSDGNGL